jgi:hypothetical protein
MIKMDADGADGLASAPEFSMAEEETEHQSFVR